MNIYGSLMDIFDPQKTNIFDDKKQAPKREAQIESHKITKN